MTENHPIIDVNPVEHSRKRITFDEARAARVGFSPRDAGADAAWRQAPSGSFADARSVSGAGQARAWSPFAALGGAVQIVAGVGLIALGVPMLILPGPGLLSIAAGALLVARGASKIRRG